LNFPIWLAHGELGSWDEMVLAAIGLIALLYFGFFWRRDHNDPFAKSGEDAASESEDVNKPTADRLD
jgi:hypothetical protein